MTAHDALPSMAKTSSAAFGAAALLAVLAVLGAAATSGIVAALLAAVLGVAAAGLLVLAAAGRLVQERQRRLETGQPDLFLLRNAERDEAAVRAGKVPAWSGARRWLARRAFGHPLLVGDEVRIKSLDAIRATLDADGNLDGLPFMEEMAAFCGQTARVYRVVDKIYDYGRSKLMRRIDDSVLLVDLRCSGASHGGCEAACYLIWKAAWLEPAHAGVPATARGGVPVSAAAPLSAATRQLGCQYTQLTTASREMPGVSVHGWLGALVVGNVTFASFRIAALTRLFNALQARRRGSTYPSRPTLEYDKTLQGEPLRAGDWVRVKMPGEIARSLDKNSKNRGLWFDGDMLKHCGQAYRVRTRVEKIIDIRSGDMVAMKTPCIMLEGVDFSGESQGFGEQHDYLYWREAWLARIAPPENVAA